MHCLLLNRHVHVHVDNCRAAMQCLLLNTCTNMSVNSCGAAMQCLMLHTYAHVCTHACQRLQRSNAEPIAEHMCACTKEGSQGWMHQHLCSAQAVVLPPEAHTRQARAMDMLFCGNAQQLTGCALTMHITCIQSDATRKKMRITCISGCSDKQEDAYNMHSG